MRGNLLAAVGAASIALMTISLAGCGEPEAARAAAAMPAPQVSVARPLTQNVVDWDDFVGRFEASRQVEVRARASGYVQAVHFRDGEAVRRGQLLYTLDPRPAQAQLEIARSQLALTRSDFTRAESLLAARAISQEEYDNRRAALRQAEATDRARSLDVEFTRITAPIAGVVSDHRVDPGNLIAGGTSAGDVLTTIVANDPMYFSFDASEALLLRYQRAQRSGGAAAVRIRLQDESDYRWTGTIDFTDNAIDANSGTIRLRAVIANGRAFLRPGMFGHARVEGSRPYAAMLVPDTAIITDGPRKLVYVVGANGQVAARAVELGPLNGGLRVVRSGLAAQDRVIVNGAQRTRPGQNVTARLTTITQSGVVAERASPVALSAPAATATAAGDIRGR